MCLNGHSFRQQVYQRYCVWLNMQMSCSVSTSIYWLKNSIGIRIQFWMNLCTSMAAFCQIWCAAIDRKKFSLWLMRVLARQFYEYFSISSILWVRICSFALSCAFPCSDILWIWFVCFGEFMTITQEIFTPLCTRLWVVLSITTPLASQNVWAAMHFNFFFLHHSLCLHIFQKIRAEFRFLYARAKIG